MRKLFPLVVLLVLAQLNAKAKVAGPPATPPGSPPMIAPDRNKFANDMSHRCFVWNPSVCSDAIKLADAKFIQQATRESTRDQVVQQLTKRGLESLFERNDPVAALDHFNHVLILDGKNADGWFGAGTTFAVMGIFDPAEKLLLKAIGLNPKKPVFYLNLGRLYGKEKNDPLKAEAQFQKALGVDPKFWEAHLNLAYSNYFQKKYKEAKVWMEKAEAAGGKVPEAFRDDLSRALSGTPRK